MADIDNRTADDSPLEAIRIADQEARLLVPCLEALYNAVMEQIPFPKDARIRILDLGSGSGLLSSILQHNWPHADITAFDLDEGQLSLATARFAESGKGLTTQKGDFRNFDFFGPYDVIVSALSLHNGTDAEKGALFQYCFSQLDPGGSFIIADRVQGPTPQGEEWYQTAWKTQARTAGAPGDMIAQAERKMTGDNCSPLVDQLLWLTLAGFQRVDCWYKSYQFAVFGGHKPKTPTPLGTNGQPTGSIASGA